MSVIAQAVWEHIKTPTPTYVDDRKNKTETIVLDRAYKRNTATIILALLALLILNIEDVRTTDTLLQTHVNGAVAREANQLAWLAYNASVLLWLKLALWINLFYRAIMRPWCVKPRKLESLYVLVLGVANGAYAAAIYSNLGNINAMHALLQQH